MRRSAPRRVIAIRAGQELPRILVVDDQPENRDWLMKLLTSIGFSVRGADNGEAAIRSWEEWNPQLILMDVHMPVMDGLGGDSKNKGGSARKGNGRCRSDSERHGSTIVEPSSESGADDFLAKPCREDELLEKMRRPSEHRL